MPLKIHTRKLPPTGLQCQVIPGNTKIMYRRMNRAECSYIQCRTFLAVNGAKSFSAEPSLISPASPNGSNLIICLFSLLDRRTASLWSINLQFAFSVRDWDVHIRQRFCTKDDIFLWGGCSNKCCQSSGWMHNWIYFFVEEECKRRDPAKQIVRQKERFSKMAHGSKY